MNQNIRTSLIVGGIVIVAVIILRAAFGWQGGSWGMMGGFGWGWLMPIFMIIFWGLVIWAIVALVRGLSRSNGSDSAPRYPDSALETLKKRYARGEIDKEEYEEKKKDLT